LNELGKCETRYAKGKTSSKFMWLSCMCHVCKTVRLHLSTILFGDKYVHPPSARPNEFKSIDVRRDARARTFKKGHELGVNGDQK
jgi:hypothetical protein